MLLSELINLHGYIDISAFWNSSDDETIQEYTQIIANRAYDLVQHTIGHSLEYLHECGHELSGSMSKRILPSIPDMATWPEEQAE